MVRFSPDGHFVAIGQFLRRQDDFAAHGLGLVRKTSDVYRYFEYPVTEYQAFLDAESRGRFFLARIRDHFRYERMAKLRAA